MLNRSLQSSVLAALMATNVISVSYADMQQGEKLSDAQIAAVVMAANKDDIEASGVAKSKAVNPNVKAFATRMEAEHTDMNKKAADLLNKLKISPQASEQSKNITDKGRETLSDLRDKSGADFDRAYIDREVALHEEVIKVIDKDLLPNAKDPQVKVWLEKSRPTLASHLEEAKRIQSELKQ